MLIQICEHRGAHYKYKSTNISQVQIQIWTYCTSAHYRYRSTNIRQVLIQIWTYVYVLIINTDVRIPAKCWHRSLNNIEVLIIDTAVRISAGCRYRSMNMLIIRYRSVADTEPCSLQRKDSQVKIQEVYVWFKCSYDPAEGHPGQQAYTFVIRILSKKEREKYFPEKEL
jgi:hypothetical protein